MTYLDPRETNKAYIKSYHFYYAFKPENKDIMHYREWERNLLELSLFFKSSRILQGFLHSMFNFLILSFIL